MSHPSLMAITIRRGRLDDWDAIQKIHKASFLQAHAPLMSSPLPWFQPQGTSFVATREGDVIVGFIYVVAATNLAAVDDGGDAYIQPGEACIDDLFVHPSCWRMGVGRKLMAAAEGHLVSVTLLRDDDINTIPVVLCVLTVAKDAIAFYSALPGWQPTTPSRPFTGPDGQPYSVFRRLLPLSSSAAAAAATTLTFEEEDVCPVCIEALQKDTSNA